MSPARRLALQADYDRHADAYQAKLTWENYMEAPTQATQRKITLESFALVVVRRPDVHVFNELLVQYRDSEAEIQGIVPDNMIVLHEGTLSVKKNYPLQLQPRPFWVMEYVSKSNERKDYDKSLPVYEKYLKVPYFLLFNPDIEEMILYRRGPRKFTSVKPNSAGRFEVPELDMETTLLDGWVRYWFKGELLPLPADLLRRAEAAEEKLKQLREQLRAMGIDPDSLRQTPAG